MKFFHIGLNYPHAATDPAEPKTCPEHGHSITNSLARQPPLPRYEIRDARCEIRKNLCQSVSLVCVSQCAQFFANFQTFHIIFRIFSNVFERFQSFSNVSHNFSNVFNRFRTFLFCLSCLIVTNQPIKPRF